MLPSPPLPPVDDKNDDDDEDEEEEERRSLAAAMNRSTDEHPRARIETKRQKVETER